MGSRREYSHTVFNEDHRAARKEAYEDARRMTSELSRRQLAGSVEVEVEQVNPRTFKIYVIVED